MFLKGYADKAYHFSFDLDAGKIIIMIHDPFSSEKETEKLFLKTLDNSTTTESNIKIYLNRQMNFL